MHIKDKYTLGACAGNPKMTYFGVNSRKNGYQTSAPGLSKRPFQSPKTFLETCPKPNSLTQIRTCLMILKIPAIPKKLACIQKNYGKQPSFQKFMGKWFNCPEKHLNLGVIVRILPAHAIQIIFAPRTRQRNAQIPQAARA